MKLYTIVRGDLPPGAQVAQTGHALIQFSLDCPDIVRTWHEESNNLVCLAVPDEEALQSLLGAVVARGISAAGFHEPDFEDELTAVVLAPEAQRLVSHLPLALRQ